MPLTEKEIRRLAPDAKPRKVSDAAGLYLLVNPNGSKLWRMNYTFQKKQKTLAFGAWPDVSLAAARELGARAKEALAHGLDPNANNKEALIDPTIAGDTFKAVAREWLNNQETSWTPAHALRVGSRFREDVFPEIGGTPIRDVTAPQILAALRKIEDRQAFDVAKRVRQSIGCVFRYAIATGRAERDVAADLSGALKPSPRVRHMARLAANEVGEFLVALRTYSGEESTRLALELTMRTLLRTNEVRFGRWAELDGDLWRIPADRMKAHRDHLVPITPRVRAILDRLRVLAGDSPWVLPGVRGKPISENTLIYAVYRMGWKSRTTVHGFRGLASTVLNEKGFSADAIERQLAHDESNRVRAAYNSAQFLKERREMLLWYGDWLDRQERKADPEILV